MCKILLFIFAMLNASLCLGAEAYPSRPVRVIVNYGPGSTADLVARVMSQQLSEQLGRTFTVENRPGASGTIGTGFVAKSAADGYTLLLADTSVSMVPGLFKSLPYDVLKDFSPVMQIMGTPNVLVVHPSLKAATLKEFVAFARANSGKLNYGSSGIGSTSHLYSQLFNREAKTNIVHIPYSAGGGSDVATALLAGQIQMLITGVPAVVAHVKSGRLRALAVTTDGKRSPSMPDVPSMNEAGLPGMVVYAWGGIVGPAGMPREVVAKLHAEMASALKATAVRDRLLSMDAEVVGSSPEEFSAHLRNEVRRWGEVIAASGITPE